MASRKKTSSSKSSKSSGKSGKSTGGSKKKQTVADVIFDASLRVLILHGKESYLVQDALRKLRESIEQSHGEVEIIHFEGGKAQAAEVLDEARSFGLLQQYKIVVVDQADEFLKETTGNRPVMERYCEHPAENATVVLRAEKWHPGKIDKATAKVGAVVKCDEVDQATAVDFCIRRATDAHESKIDPKTATLLVHRLGTALNRLDSEIERLALMADPKEGISSQLVNDQVQMSREEQAWVIQQALMASHPAEAMVRVRELMEVSRQPAALVFYCLSDLARKLYASGKMREDGRPLNEIDDYLGRWNQARHAIKEAASRVPPRQFATLMQETLNVPVRNRTGLGDDRRGIDMLTVRFLASRSGKSR